MQLGTIGASTTGSISLDFVPEKISFIATTVPTSLIVNISKVGVTYNLDGNGITELATVRKLGQVTDGFELPLSNGRIDNRTCKITIANAVAGVLTVDGRWDAMGTALVFADQIPGLANGSVEVEDFWNLALPELTTNDTVTVDYRDVTDELGRVIQKGAQGVEITLRDIEQELALTQNEVNGIVVLDNSNLRIKRVRVTSAAAQTFYKQWLANTQDSIRAKQQA